MLTNQNSFISNEMRQKRLYNSCQSWVVKLLSDPAVRRAESSRLDGIPMCVEKVQGLYLLPALKRKYQNFPYLPIRQLRWSSWDRSTHGRESL
jgi:hypothetical protein